MKDENKTKKQLIEELKQLRKRVGEEELLTNDIAKNLESLHENVKEYDGLFKFVGMLLEIFSKNCTRKEFYDDMVKYIQNLSRCRCVGIRIIDKEGYIPYESYIGFDEEFWRSENWIAVNQCACACMRVVAGKLEPQDVPAASKGGSFFCNSLAEYFNSLSEEYKTRFRGKCEQNGYKSVAVIPISHQGKIIGAVHIADEKTDMVPLQLVETIESIAPLIGMAAAEYDLERELKRNFDTIYMLDRILNTMSGAAYIVDTEKYEILYVNKAFMDMYRKNPVGGTCFRELFNLDSPCSFCMNGTIKKNKGMPYQWEFHHPLLNKDFMLIDRIIEWPDGRDVRFEFAVDITSRKQMEETLKHRLKLEETLEDISSRFVSVYNFDDAINQSLAELGLLCSADRAYLFVINSQNGTVTNTHEWCAEGAMPKIHKLKDLPMSAIPWGMAKLQNGEMIQINDIKGIPAEAEAEKLVMESQDVKSLIVLPIYTGGGLTGFIGFDYLEQANVWDNEDLSLLSIAAGIFSRAIESRKGEVALWESERKYWSLFTNSPCALVYCQIILDAKGSPVDYKVLEINKAFMEITGMKAEQLVGKKRTEIMQFTRHPIFDEFSISSEVAISGKRENFQRVFGKKWFNISVFSPYKGYFVVLLSDITEEKLLQEKLQNTNKEFVNTIRKLRLTQGQLISNEKLASIGQLAAGIAHEVNNPLSFVMSNFETMKGYAQKCRDLLSAYTALKDILDNIEIQNSAVQGSLNEVKRIEQKTNIDYILSDAEDLFRDVEDGLDRIYKIVKSLRSFSKVDSINEIEEYDLNEGIKDTLAIAKNEIKYDSRVQENLNIIPKIYVNGSQINQVLLNIIINAAQSIKLKKLNEPGLISITTYSDNKFVCCDIEDNGIGISKENIDKIFDPFYTTKPIGMGVGLGLSISYDVVVNKLKGELAVQSTVGSGTKFTIKLPIITERLPNK